MNEVKYCPKCGSMTLIVDSRTKMNGIWRRRKCENPECDYMIKTMECIFDKHKARENNEDTILLNALAERLLKASEVSKND